MLVSVRERHEAGGEVVNELVSLPADGSAEPRVIASGHDFYAAPRISPDGRHLAWLSWDHPRMPWDGTELWTAELAGDGSVTGERLVAGGPAESILQPLWSPSGELWFASDRTGWWNLYAIDPARPGDTGLPEPCPLVTRAAEFAGVPWVFGLQNYAFLDDGRLLVCYTEDGRDHLAVLDAAGGTDATPAAGADATPAAGASHVESPLRELDSPYTVVYSLTPLGGRAGMIAATHTEGWQVVVLDPASGAAEVVRRGRPVPIDPAYISRPEPIVFPTEGGLTAHANYYAPANPDFSAPDGELPPLLVNVHGGPTSSHDAKLDLDVQYWTSRGIAVVDVNYGGSTGYGREYRERLKGEWGVVDTVDSINAARYLIARGDADPARVGVRGGSAGGYTTLNALDALRLLQRRRQPLRPRRPRVVRHRRHAQVRVAVPRQPRRPVSGAPRRLPRTLAHPSRRRHQLPRDPAPGPGGRHRPARAGGHHRRGAAAQRACPTPTWGSRASSTASARRRTSSAPRRRSCTSTGACGGSRRPTRSSRSTSRTWTESPPATPTSG